MISIMCSYEPHTHTRSNHYFLFLISFIHFFLFYSFLRSSSLCLHILAFLCTIFYYNIMVFSHRYISITYFVFFVKYIFFEYVFVQVVACKYTHQQRQIGMKDEKCVSTTQTLASPTFTFEHSNTHSTHA